jgi:hypothetical protein
MRTHVVVWLDHTEARVFHVEPETPGHPQPEPVDEATILSPQHHIHRHPKGWGDPGGHPEDAARFFHEIARAVEGADALLIVGPALTKMEFAQYLDTHDRALRAKVAGVETVDHPTDREMVAYARKYFKASDRM